MKASDYEIGDSVVFGHTEYGARHPQAWTEGRITNIAGDVLKIRYVWRFGIVRHKWVAVTSSGRTSDWQVHRQQRAEELIARYDEKPALTQ